MGSYLDFSETVLRMVRRPMSARSILKIAYSHDLVPSNLFGVTQHKTLQARLSIDILENRDFSRFYRTKPGHFFLREFIDDETIPKKYRVEMYAPRRSRELIKGNVLALSPDVLSEEVAELSASDLLQKLYEAGDYHYVDIRTACHQDFLTLWAVTCVKRGDEYLSYRVGRYRDDRDHFLQKRSFCFSAPVTESCRSLFDSTDLGTIDCGLAAVAQDLDIPMKGHRQLADGFSHRLRFFSTFSNRKAECYFAVIEVDAPDWYDPYTRRLSINEVEWLSLRALPNHLDDFDPWSKAVLSLVFGNKDVASKSAVFN